MFFLISVKLPAFSPSFPAIPTWFPAFSPLFPAFWPRFSSHSPHSPHYHPDSPHSLPDSLHSHPYSQPSHPHSQHCLHFVPQLPVLVFTDRLLRAWPTKLNVFFSCAKLFHFWCFNHWIQHHTLFCFKKETTCQTSKMVRFVKIVNGCYMFDKVLII